MVKIFLQFLTVFSVFKLQCIFFCLNYWNLTEEDNFCICLLIFPGLPGELTAYLLHSAAMVIKDTVQLRARGLVEVPCDHCPICRGCCQHRVCSGK